MVVESSGLLSRLASKLVAEFAPGNTAQTPPPQQQGNPWEGLRVTLSAQGQERAQQAEKNRDIEESDLPVAIKELLLRIRELKQQLAAKQEELVQLMGKTALSEQDREVKVEQLQVELNSLSSALAQANNLLLKTMSEAGMTDDQERQVALLIV